MAVTASGSGSRRSADASDQSTSLLEALDQTLRDFVAARPELPVALIADEQACSLAVVAPGRFRRRMASLLAAARLPTAEFGLLIVRLTLEDLSIPGATVRLSVSTASATLGSLAWPCATHHDRKHTTQDE